MPKELSREELERHIAGWTDDEWLHVMNAAEPNDPISVGVAVVEKLREEKTRRSEHEG